MSGQDANDDDHAGFVDDRKAVAVLAVLLAAFFGLAWLLAGALT